VTHATAADASLPRDVDARLLGIDRIEGHLPPWCVRAASPSRAGVQPRGGRIGTSMTRWYHRVTPWLHRCRGGARARLAARGMAPRGFGSKEGAARPGVRTPETRGGCG
jgi:hypothetical protein